LRRKQRPIMITVSATMAGLMPIMWSHRTGSEVMKRIAAPLVDGTVLDYVFNAFLGRYTLL
jgi:Cu(I)/Ag(I) efflux system membrane protein CusA/SilA